MSDFEELGSELIIQHTGQVFPLTQETVTIGRGEDNVIVLADPKVSSQHATITWQAETGSYVIEDLGSAEGTYVNERPVEGPQPLRHGDVIRVGDTIFDLKLKPTPSAAGVPPTPPPIPADAEEPRRGSRNPVLAGIVIVLLVGVTIVCAALFAVLLFGGGGDTPSRSRPRPMGL
jgi:pSer/pThr/pTyr-binding forkhead associated (FHA) protein